MMMTIRQDEGETSGTITPEEILPEDQVVETLMVVVMVETGTVVAMTRVEEEQLVRSTLEIPVLVMTIQEGGEEMTEP